MGVSTALKSGGDCTVWIDAFLHQEMGRQRRAMAYGPSPRGRGMVGLEYSAHQLITFEIIRILMKKNIQQNGGKQEK